MNQDDEQSRAQKIANVHLKTDNWAIRQQGMACRTCIWYVPKVPTAIEKPAGYQGIGRCRRHAPTMNGFPVVWISDWCGDHKLDENK